MIVWPSMPAIISPSPRRSCADGVNLAILGIAGYDPYIRAHATPEQAWAMAEHCRADFLLPIHHSTFRLSYEPMEEPVQRMLEVAGNDADRVAVREVGGQWAL